MTVVSYNFTGLNEGHLESVVNQHGSTAGGIYNQRATQSAANARGRTFCTKVRPIQPIDRPDSPASMDFRNRKTPTNIAKSFWIPYISLTLHPSAFGTRGCSLGVRWAEIGIFLVKVSI